MDNLEKVESHAFRLNVVCIPLQKFQNGIVYKIFGLIMVANPIIRKPHKIVEIILDYLADDFVPGLLEHTFLF